MTASHHAISLEFQYPASWVRVLTRLLGCPPICLIHIDLLASSCPGASGKPPALHEIPNTLPDGDAFSACESNLQQGFDCSFRAATPQQPDMPIEILRTDPW